MISDVQSGKIRPQRRGDKFIDTRNFNRIAYSASLGKSQYDPQFFMVNFVNGFPMVSLRPDALPSTAIWARLTAWNAGTLSYDWSEIHWDTEPATDLWIDVDGGQNSDIYGEGVAFGEFADLPIPTTWKYPVIMFLASDLQGEDRPMFIVPPQHDVTGITHRTDATASPTAGNREDLTMTAAELADNTHTMVKEQVGAQTADKGGFIVTRTLRHFYNATDHKWEADIQDIELDLLLRPVSTSNILYNVEILALEEQTVVADIQVNASTPGFEEQTNTIWVPEAGTQTGWTGWHTGANC